MAATDRTTLKGYFNTGDVPTQSNFGDLIDSFSRNLVFDVRDYGAVGDGSTDNTTAIQNAINAAAGSGTGWNGAGAGTITGGGIVYFPPGTYLTGQLVMANFVTLQGSGQRSTTIKLKNAANVDLIINHVSTNGTTDPNAEYCTIRDLTLDGNKTNQTGTSRGIFFNTNPLWTAATNDYDFDTHHQVSNVLIYNCHDDGFAANGRADHYLSNVEAYYCNGNGFSPSTDTTMVGCVAGQSGLNGFNVQTPAIRLWGCKAFYSGQVTVSGSSGNGLYVVYSHGGCEAVGFEAQDNRAAGINISTSESVRILATLDSNSTSGSGAYPGIDLWHITNSIIEIVAFERKANGSTSYQANAIRIRGNSADNHIVVTHNAENGAVIQNEFMTGSSTLGNEIIVKSIGGVQTGTYAASYTPDFRNGGTILLTLTGAITINAPAVDIFSVSTAYAGMPRVSFVFTQDATGGRVVTWNAVYKTNWTPDTTANKTNTITFAYDGTNFIQVGASISI